MAAAPGPTPAGGDPGPGHLFHSQEDRRKEEEGSDESEEEEEVESDDEGSDVDSLASLCGLDAGSDEDPTFDPDAHGDLEVEAVLRARMSRMSISASARKGRLGSGVCLRFFPSLIGYLDTICAIVVDRRWEFGVRFLPFIP